MVVRRVEEAAMVTKLYSRNQYGDWPSLTAFSATEPPYVIACLLRQERIN